MKKILVLGLVGAFAAAPTFAETIADDETTEVEEVAIDSGAYIGLGLGGEFGSTKGYVSKKNTADADDDVYGDMYKKNCNKIFGVVSLGYNHVFGKFLAGVGGAYSFGEKKKNQVHFNNTHEANKPAGDTDAEFRTESGNTPEAFAKFGMICCKKNLVYVKLGAAWPQTKYVDTANDNYTFDGKKNKVAFKVAVGYERAFTKNVSGFIEYAYTANSKKTYEHTTKAGDPAESYTAKFDHKQQGSHSFVVGASYSFSIN